jgi:N-alpha-acetyl-L-2,4-diaminobutyrate deacetylase
VLNHAGIIRGEPEISNSIDLTMPDEKCFVPSVTTGLLEMCAELGDHVEKGQIIARIHNTEHMGIKPVEYPCPLNGIFIGRHYPGLITSGDIIAVIALEVTEPA